MWRFLETAFLIISFAAGTILGLAVIIMHIAINEGLLYRPWWYADYAPILASVGVLLAGIPLVKFFLWLLF